MKRVIASARAKIWSFAIGLLLILFSVIAPQFKVVSTLAEKRGSKSFIMEKVEATRMTDVRGMRQNFRKQSRLNHFRNRLDGELAKLGADKLQDVPFEPFGVKFTVPFEFAPLIWIALSTVMIFVMVSARQRGLNLLANALTALPKGSPEKSNAHLLATPPVWFAPVWLSDGLDSVGKDELLRALGWNSSHNRIFTALTGIFLLTTLIAQIWVAYIGHQIFLARCAFKKAFVLWPFQGGLEADGCNLTWTETLCVVGEVAVLVFSIAILAAWLMPIAVRRLEEPPQGFLILDLLRISTFCRFPVLPPHFVALS